MSAGRVAFTGITVTANYAMGSHLIGLAKPVVKGQDKEAVGNWAGAASSTGLSCAPEGAPVATPLLCDKAVVLGACGEHSVQSSCVRYTVVAPKAVG